MRIPHVVRLALVVALLSQVVSAAEAGDRRLVGAKVKLGRASSGKEQLTFQSKDPMFVFPAQTGPNDPTQNGLTVEILTSGPTVSLAVPPGIGKPGWALEESGGGLVSYRFNNSHAPNALGTLKDAHLRKSKQLQVKGTSIGSLPLAGGQGPLAIRITAGSDRSCALFGGAAVTRDTPGRFAGKNTIAASGDTCSAHSLGFATCGNGVVEPEEDCDGAAGVACPGLCTGSCTCPPPACGNGITEIGESCDGASDAACLGACQPNCRCLGTCGDGIVNAPGEECDGSDGGTIGCDGSLGVGCDAGCSCCSISGFFCGDFGCCTPGQACIPGPHFSGTCVGP